MKTRWIPLLGLLLGLSACSSINSDPDSVVEDSNSVTAVKQIGDSDFELRLSAGPIDEQNRTFEVEAGLRYTGDLPEITIGHGDPLFVVWLSTDGESLTGPVAIKTVGLSTRLTANEWLTEDIVPEYSRTQFRKFVENDGEVTLGALFDAEGYEYEQQDGAYISLEADEIPR